MAKKKAAGSKVSAKAAKKAKAATKTERKEKKKTGGKSKVQEEDDDENLEAILEKMRREWEEAHSVTEELAETPSRRANATLTACPNGNHLWCIGGEFFSDDNKAYFYNDVFRYNPEKDEWRKFVSKVCPGPRSAHAVAASPAGGGKLFLFGGEFSSLHQNTFHHYADFWVFDITTHSWDRIETKERPSARSGHRMAIWKHYIVLFGGFYDPGITTRYLNDLWLFDTQEYKWREIKFTLTELRPTPRSGFSFLPTPDGIVLHGGYCKEYAKGKRPVGVMLEDTWFLNLTLTTPEAGTSSKADPLKVKWERRKRPSTAYAPPLRSGCTMAVWQNKSMGVQFGGVTDEDTSEETLESVFWNDLNAYQWTGKGRWVSLTLKKPKKKGKAGKSGKSKPPPTPQSQNWSAHHDDEDGDWDNDIEDGGVHLQKNIASVPKADIDEDAIDPDDPVLTTPMPRYNAMLAVLRNTLYLYGGIFEKGSREYTLEDFYKIDLDKMDRFVCLKESSIFIDDKAEESSEDDDDDDDEDDDDEDDDDEQAEEGEEIREPEAGEDPIQVTEETENTPAGEDDVDTPPPATDDGLRTKATHFMGVARDTTRSAEDVISTPLPGETLAMFYARSREHWAQVAHARGAGDNRGKQLRRDGFVLAQDRYAEYKPVLKEVEKILAEAGLDEEEMRRGAAAGPAGAQTQSRNRR